MQTLGALDHRHLVEDGRLRRLVRQEERAHPGIGIDRGQFDDAGEAEAGKMPLAREPPLERHPLGDGSDDAVHA